MSASLGTLVVSIGANMTSLATSVKKSKSEMTRLQTTSTKVTKKIDSNFKRIGKTIGGLTSSVFNVRTAFLALAAIGITKVFMGITSAIEQSKIALDTLTAGRGKETLNTLMKWASQMPVNTMEAINQFRLLRAYGLQPSIKDMTTLVDTFSALGADREALKGIVRAFGQIATKPRLAMQELRQLAEWGVPSLTILKEELNLTGKEFDNMATSGLTSSQVIKALLTGMEKRFGGLSKKMMKTWKGITLRMEHQWMMFRLAVMESGPFEVIKKSFAKIVTYLESGPGQKAMVKWAHKMAEIMLTMVNTILTAIETLVFTIIPTIQQLALATDLVTKDIAFSFSIIGEAVSPVIQDIKSLTTMITNSEKQISSLPITIAKVVSGYSLMFKQLTVSIVTAMKNTKVFIQQGWTIIKLSVVGFFDWFLVTTRKATAKFVNFFIQGINQIIKAINHLKGLPTVDLLPDIKLLPEMPEEVFLDSMFLNTVKKLQKEVEGFDISKTLQNNNKIAEKIYNEDIKAVANKYTEIEKIHKLSSAKLEKLQKKDRKNSNIQKYIDQMRVIIQQGKSQVTSIENSNSALLQLGEGMAIVTQAEKDAVALRIKEEHEKIASDKRKANSFSQYADQINDIHKNIQNAGVAAFKSMEDALVSFVMTGKLQFTDFVNVVLQGIARIMIQKSIMGPIAAGIDMIDFGSMFGSKMVTAGQAGHAPIPGVKPVQTFAKGGWITEPVAGVGQWSGKRYSIGENQAEFVTPAGAMGTGGGSNEVSIHIHEAPPDTRVEKSTTGGGERIDIFFDKQVAAALGKDGASSRILEARYGLSQQLTRR